jgi:hypothetical protein
MTLLLYPREKAPLVPIELEAGWVPEPVWRLWSKEKSLAPARNWTLAIQPIASCYIDCAITAPPLCNDSYINPFRANSKHTCLWVACPKGQHWMKNPACMGKRVYCLHESWDKATRFHFISCAGVLLGGRFKYTAMWSQIQLAPSVMARAWGRTMGSTANGSWENYHMAGEHMLIATCALEVTLYKRYTSMKF